jgi:hypothetical protein
MKKIAIALALVIAGAAGASAQYLGQSNNRTLGDSYGTDSNPNSHSVDGYTRNNGTYVAPHQQTNPNNTQTDNYGSRPNVNPYTGQVGTRAPRY